MIWRIAATIILFCAVFTGRSQTLETLLTNGPTASRINIVFLAEGYTAAQTNKFRTNALTILNAMLNTPPMADYRNYFNAYGIFVASAESGSDHPVAGIFRNTYFNSSYDCFGLGHLLMIPPHDRDPEYANGRGKVDTLLAAHMPEFDLAAMIVNDTAYGGSGGTPLVTSLDASATEIALHEMGHSYAGLGDEYDTAYPGYPDIEEPNTTRTTNRAQIKWNAWIAPATPLPTPEISGYSNMVGLFEGAHYHTTGWYRPKLDCKMKTLNRPFCEVCAQTLITATYGLVRPIEAVTPGTNAVPTLLDTQAMTFAVQSLQPIGSQIAFQWYTNTVAVPDATNGALTLSGSALGLGTNQIFVTARDNTAKVRFDPFNSLQDNRLWRVRVQATRPALRISRNGIDVTLSWPAWAETFRVERATSVTGSWQALNGTPVRSGDEWVLVDQPPTGSVFYRIVRR